MASPLDQFQIKPIVSLGKIGIIAAHVVKQDHEIVDANHIEIGDL